MTFITLYALFGDDIRALCVSKLNDEYFWIFNIIAMIMFFIEIIVASIARVKLTIN